MKRIRVAEGETVREVLFNRKTVVFGAGKRFVIV